MRVVCVRAIGHHKPGDTAEVPDGSEVSALYYEAAPEPAAPPLAAARPDVPAKESA